MSWLRCDGSESFTTLVNESGFINRCSYTSRYISSQVQYCLCFFLYFSLKGIGCLVISFLYLLLMLMSLRLQRVALEHGLILVDTKYEFGKDSDGSILLIDEVRNQRLRNNYYSLSLSLIHINLHKYTNIILTSFCNSRCIHLTQAGTGLLILMKSAFRMVLNLKMLIRSVFLFLMFACYLSSMYMCFDVDKGVTGNFIFLCGKF